MNNSSKDYLVNLRRILTERFDESELRTLCFDLGIEYENLPGLGKADKARELVAYSERHDHISDLVRVGKKQRPDIPWAETLETTPVTTQHGIGIECSDIVNLACDVVVLKYAQAFYGADSAVASRINDDHTLDISPRPGQYTLLPSRGKIAARQVLFVGVPQLYQLDYGEIREFASRAMQILARNMPSAKHIAMTIHGAGYGLDETECFLAQLAGLSDAFRTEAVPPFLKRITIVERNQGRATRLGGILREHLPTESLSRYGYGDSTTPPSRISVAGAQSSSKPHVFVAIPFSEEMEDTYVFGIQGPVNIAGYLCERVDLTTFTGDILGRIKSRIETASLVIADLTGANPNVYLEVGYAWGKNRPTLLVAKKGEELRFDVQSQRCLIYKSIQDLAKKLEADLASLATQ